MATIAKCFTASTAFSQIFMVSFCFAQNKGDMDDELAQEESDMLFSMDDMPEACKLQVSAARRPTATVSCPPKDSESTSNTMEQALSAPVVIPFGLPCRDEAGWRWNADKEEIQTQSIWRQH